MKKIFGLTVFVFGLLLMAGSVSASSADVLQPASDITYTETVRVPSIYVGSQGSGGVTFFNGTIINSTTNDGADNPVTFGDNVRIDGRVHRGEDYGPESDGKTPFIINDNVEIAGNLTLSGDFIGDAKITADNLDSYTTPADGMLLMYDGGRLAWAEIGTDTSDDTDDTSVTIGDITAVTTAAGSGLTGGGTSGNVALSVSGVTSAMITNGTIAAADLASDSVTSAKIADSTIVDADISNSTNITTSGNLVYSPRKSRTYSVLGDAFYPRVEDADFVHDLGYLNQVSAFSNASVHLPDGAIVTSMIVHYEDALVDNFTVTFLRNNMAGTSNDIAEVTTNTATPGFTTGTDLAVDNATVDNDAYAYKLTAESMTSSALHKLGGVEITYTVGNPLP